MAFPDNVDAFLQAQDPQNSQDIQNINTYQSLLNGSSENPISDAHDYLMRLSNGIQMSLNAGRYNQVIDAIVAIENFYLGLNGVKEYIQNNASAFTNYKQWSGIYNYSIGNFVGHNGSWYSCIQENTNIEPGINPNWQNYWILILQPQSAIQYPIQIFQPEGQNIGDLWFQIIPIEETWVLNATLNSDTLNKANAVFTYTEGVVTTFFSAIGKDNSSNQLKYYHEDNSFIIAYNYSTNTWTSDAMKTLKFEDQPSGELLTWLQSNGTKQ